MKANALSEKLQFVLRIIGQWVANGGLGKLDEDNAFGGGLGMRWTGAAVGEGAKKVDLVSVGRRGGDDGVKA